MKHLLVIGFATLALTMGCKSATEVQQPAVGQNLIGNSSFEQGGKFSREGWPAFRGWGDSSTDVPPGGGMYSLALQVTAPENAVQAGIAPITRPGIFSLSFWIKAVGGALGSVSLGQTINGGFVADKTYVNDSIGWHQVTMLDTLSSAGADTLYVQLHSGFGDLIPGSVLFDNVDLKRLQ